MVILASAAAAAMFCQDLLAVLMVQAEARNKATLAAILDCLGWPAGMVTTAVTVTALQGHDGALKGAVFAAVTCANYAGTWTAVRIGRRHIKENRAGCACGCPVAAKEA